MKSINLYINESLVKSKPVGTFIKFTYHPKTKEELVENIKTELENGNANLNCIDTSEITDMSHLFDKHEIKDINPHNYNIDISQWDVSNVRDMKHMFFHCQYISCDLSNWDIRNVESMWWMFGGCEFYEGKGLENWDVSKVKDMSCMFYSCKNLKCDLSNWNINIIKEPDIKDMFEDSNYERLYGRTPKTKNGKLIKI